MSHERIFLITPSDDFSEGGRHIDEERHRRKLEEAIRDDLPTIVGDGSIIFEDPDADRIIRIPMKTLEIPDFRFGDTNQGVGAGEGNEGDAIGITPGSGQGQGAGGEAGIEYYDEYWTVEEIKELVYSQLGLPNLRRKKHKVLRSDEITFDDFRKKRSDSSVDIPRTILSNIERNAREHGKSEIKGLNLDDFVVRTWKEKKGEEKSAVNVILADISGSIGDAENLIRKVMCWWTLDFLQTKYHKVETVLIVHESQAYLVENNADFFKRGTSGGTNCSSATNLGYEEIKKRFPPDQYNIYFEHYSDGDNYEDNRLYVESVQRLLDLDINQFAFIQVGKDWESALVAHCRGHISDPRFKYVIVGKSADMLAALEKIFSGEK